MGTPIKNGTIPNIYDKSEIYIHCECGGKVTLSRHLYMMWLERGIKFRCPQCDIFISNKENNNETCDYVLCNKCIKLKKCPTARILGHNGCFAGKVIETC